MKRILTSFLLMLTMCAVVHAVPAFPVRKRILTTDGRSLMATLQGDEYMKYYLSDEGQAFRELEDGLVCEMEESEFNALLMSRAQPVQHLRMMASPTGATRAMTGGYYQGVKPALVVLVEFTDVAMTVGTKAVYEDFTNKPGYSDFGMSGSVRDYFMAQSYGQFTMDFDVVGPYRLKNNMAYYGAHTSTGGNDVRAGEMIAEAVQMADEDVDFSRYDWDGDGEVDQVYVVYAGYGEAQGGPAESVWPHASSIAGRGIVLDGVRLGRYACGNELRGSRGNVLDGNGTLCHEFSHCLGLPDDYDVAYTGNYGTGNFDLMCSGCYNNNGCTPAAYTSWQRWMCGWLTPTEIKSETEITGMEPLTVAPEAYVLYNERNRDEFYLLENRQQIGFDASIKGHGLMVLHVDYDADIWNGNAVNSNATQHMVYIPADGVLSAGSESGDPYPGSKKVTALTDLTPVAATLNTMNRDGKKLMHKPVEDIKEAADGTISALVCAPLLGIPAFNAPSIGENEFTITWSPVPTATSYTVEVKETKLKGSPAEAVVLTEDFSGCYKSSVGFTDISSQLNQYLSTRGFTGSKLYTTPNLLRIGSSTASGSLATPLLPALQTQGLTVAMHLVPMKSDSKTKGTVGVYDSQTRKEQSLPFTLTSDSVLVLNTTTPVEGSFRVTITPESGVYIQGLTLYDGIFTAEELAAASAKVSRRRVAPSYETSACSLTIDDAHQGCMYELRICATSPRQTSGWSETYTVLLDASGVQQIEAPTTKLSGTVYDLMGRPVNPNILQRGIYVRDGQKFYVR